MMIIKIILATLIYCGIGVIYANHEESCSLQMSGICWYIIFILWSIFLIQDIFIKIANKIKQNKSE